MSIIYVGIGFMMLIAGRPLYWIFVGSIGFLAGNYLVGRAAFVPAEWNHMLLPVMMALVGIAGAFFVRRWSARVAGFIAGGYLWANLLVALGAGTQNDSLPLTLAAGAVAFLLLVFLFDAGLVLLSSLTAVTLILSSIKMGNLDQGAMFIILVVLGLITQYLLLQYGKPSPD
jgi:hypothetical protein